MYFGIGHKEKQENRGNIESLILQVDGRVTGGAYIWGGGGGL